MEEQQNELLKIANRFRWLLGELAVGHQFSRHMFLQWADEIDQKLEGIGRRATTDPSYEFHGTDEADARLIATAPDMLALLKKIVLLPDPFLLSEIHEVRAVITKPRAANMFSSAVAASREGHHSPRSGREVQHRRWGRAQRRGEPVRQSRTRLPLDSL